MQVKAIIKSQLKIHRGFGVQFLAILVAVHGLYVIASTLVSQLAVHHHVPHLSGLFYDLPLLLGLSAVYISTLLKRRKRTAWLVTVLGYGFYMILSISQLLSHIATDHFGWMALVRVFILPLAILGMLFALHKEFIVKSDIQGFSLVLRFSLIVLVVALLYGVIGFELMDTSDFHQEISWPSAFHYTIDQFNLTTNKPVHPYTARAKAFVDSLSVISFGAVVYVAFSLFQPLKARYADQSAGRDRVRDLLGRYPAPSEEFFKVWPHDKQYFFDETGESALAFHTYRGVALCLSDPVGDKRRFKTLINDFEGLCFNNDWLPALVHVSSAQTKLYEKAGYSLQKLGQEAVVDIKHFQENLRDAKYFRQILNKFTKQNYSYELLSPPHHQAVIDRLRTVSDEWLSRGGRSERGFVMGYFTPEYMQQCQLFVSRDAAGTIQAFANLVPADFNHEEATYDLLRHSNKALTNVTDYLLINLISELDGLGYTRLNMGLSPLAGLDEVASEERTMLDNVLRFAYANGDRFYSFSGLYKFKAKYEPTWEDKYLGYKNGLRGFSKTMTALTRLMSKVVRL